MPIYFICFQMFFGLAVLRQIIDIRYSKMQTPDGNLHRNMRSA